MKRGNNIDRRRIEFKNSFHGKRWKMLRIMFSAVDLKYNLLEIEYTRIRISKK